jgi:RNA polymerase sigma factor (sigma-70 family)
MTGEESTMEEHREERLQEPFGKLIERAKQGEQAAFGTVVARYQNVAVGYAFTLLGDRQLAQDAAQEAFVDAYYKLHQLANHDAFGGWLRTIVFKHCDRIKRRQKAVLVPLDSMPIEDRNSPQDMVADDEVKTRLEQAVAGLSLRDRQVVALFYYGDQSLRQVAEFLQISIDAVKNRLRAARKQLKGTLSDIAEDYWTAQRPARAHDLIIAVDMRLRDLDLSPDSEAEWSEEGFVLRRREGWSTKSYRTPILIEAQVRSADANHVRLLFGEKGAVHVHWRDGGFEYVDPVTAYPYRHQTPPRPVKEWVQVSWLIAEDKVAVHVDGDEMFRGTGRYRGLGGKAGIGTNNVSREPLMIQSFKVTELTVDPLHDGRIAAYRQSSQGIVHDSLQTAGFHSSQLGCMQGCAEFLGVPIRPAWLFGITGQAFLIAVDRGIGPIEEDRSYRVSEQIRRLAGHAGLTVHSFTGRATDEELAKGWEQARAALDAGLPCYAWEIELQGEYGIIYGYDRNGCLVKGWHGAHGPIPWDRLGRLDTNENELAGHVELCWVERGAALDERTAMRQGLQFAIEHWSGSSAYIAHGVLTGDAAYEEWMRAMQEGEATRFGTCYHASVWQECRGFALRFLREEVYDRVQEEAKPVVAEAISHYQIVYEQLERLYSELFPWPQPRVAVAERDDIEDAVRCLTLARDADRLAIRTLEQLAALL